MPSELIISLVVTMITSIILFTTTFFICGCVFGRLWQKRKQPTETSVSTDTHLQLSQQVEQTVGPIVPAEQDLEIMENVAYGPLKITITK